MQTRAALAILAAVWVLPAAAAASIDQTSPALVAPAVDGFDPDVREAIMDAYDAAVADPGSAPAAGRLGMVLQVHGQLAEAQVAYERAIALDPDAFEWHYYLALLLTSDSKPAEAVDELSRALAIRPDPRAQYRKADLLYDQGLFDESGAVYEEMLASDPDFALALYGLARVRQAQDDLDEAIDLYTRAIRSAPTFGAAYYGLARLEARLGRTDEAEAHFELASRHADDRPALAEPLVDRLNALATGVNERLALAGRLVNEGRAGEAAAIYEDLLTERPDDLNVLSNLLKVMDFLGRFDEVERLYRTGIERHPAAPALHRTYATSMLRQGRLDEAREALREALRLDPDFAEALTTMGEVFEAQGRTMRAMNYYRRALLARPTYRAARFDYARLLLASGRNQQALDEFDRVIAEDVDNPLAPAVTVSAMVLAATALERLGDLDAARGRLEDARRTAVERGTTDLLPTIDAERARIAASD